MFESLTRYLPELDVAKSYGEWIIDHESKGTRDDPIRMPYVIYDSLVMDIERAIYSFMKEHSESGLNRHGDMLEENEMKRDGQVMTTDDVSELDGQAVMALLMGAVRAERFCEGALLGFFEDGSIKRWLERLKEIDEMSA